MPRALGGHLAHSGTADPMRLGYDEIRRDTTRYDTWLVMRDEQMGTGFDSDGNEVYHFAPVAMAKAFAARDPDTNGMARTALRQVEQPRTLKRGRQDESVKGRDACEARFAVRGRPTSIASALQCAANQASPVD